MNASINAIVCLVDGQPPLGRSGLPVISSRARKLANNHVHKKNSVNLQASLHNHPHRFCPVCR